MLCYSNDLGQGRRKELVLGELALTTMAPGSRLGLARESQ